MLERKTVSQCVSSDYCKGWNDAMDAMPKWVGVEERLPEKTGKYIVCTAKKSVYCTRFKTHHGGGNFQTDINTHVTHWMPLPPCPGEVK